ncbi:peptidoglycan-binding protein [Streptomyces sp. BBFR102]|uniref:peptidoglycan-binding protein n=1 Tax=Streptomyces sp. BBFR102 TaxID=3448171 RepID=UPI003F53DBDE
MSISIISRSTWGARAWNGTPANVPLSRRTEFFVHWFGGVPGNPTGAALAREVERLHMNGNGWAGVGYNFIVDQNGAVYEGRGWGLQGAHCPGHNVSGFGVLVAVGKGGAKASAKALSAARALYDEACRKTGRPLAKKGHRDGIATECPGPDLYAWVKSGMPADGYDAPSGGGSGSRVARYQVTINGLKYGYGAQGSHVTTVGQALVAKGFGRHYAEGPGPSWSDADTLNYADFQKSLGYTGSDADGVPGESSLKKLLGTLPGATASKPAAKSTIVALNSAVRPGATHSQVKELQQLLVKAGYGPIPGAYTTYYGAETQKAVARFHNKNSKFRSVGKSYDPAIGKLGFTELQKEAGRK